MNEPDDPLAQIKGLRDAGRLDAAAQSCRELLDRDHEEPEAHRLLATIRYSEGDLGGAVESFEEARRLAPGDAKIHKQLAAVLTEAGSLAEAEASARTAVELRPDYVGAHGVLTTLKRFASADDPDLRALEALDRDGNRGVGERIELSFALAKAYDDLGNRDSAFRHLLVANRLKRQTLDYDPEKELRFFERVEQVFTERLLEQLSGAGTESEVPILIVGMPRSGTSLVEQILASHPSVHGGGERPDLHDTATAVWMLSSGGGYPEGVPQLRRQELTRLGEGYAGRLGAGAEGASGVTDKALVNFCHLGFTRLIAPRGHVIHVLRDPIDTCFSCFALNFGGRLGSDPGPPFVYDLDELGSYYRGYAALMEHWRRVLPPEWILELRYEDLVADLEGQARRLVAHCDLPWDDACLRFDRTPRAVRTASATQVRQPIYGSSVGRGRRYAAHLGPLLEALGPLAG